MFVESINGPAVTGVPDTGVPLATNDVTAVGMPSDEVPGTVVNTTSFAGDVPPNSVPRNKKLSFLYPDPAYNTDPEYVPNPGDANDILVIPDPKPRVPVSITEPPNTKLAAVDVITGTFVNRL